MASSQSTEANPTSHTSPNRVSLLVSEYRLAIYGLVAILSVWFLGYAVDLLAGPYNDSTNLAHTVSGLLGATAMVIALCAVLVGSLWAVLVVSNR